MGLAEENSSYHCVQFDVGSCQTAILCLFPLKTGQINLQSILQNLREYYSLFSKGLQDFWCLSFLHTFSPIQFKTSKKSLSNCELNLILKVILQIIFLFFLPLLSCSCCPLSFTWLDVIVFNETIIIFLTPLSLLFICPSI